MKNVRNTLLVTTAAVAAGLLAALCSGCDGSGEGEVGDGDAGRADAGGVAGGDAGRVDVVRQEAGVASDAGRADAGGVAGGDAGRVDVVRQEVGVASDARATSCQVPEPKFSLNGLVTTKPRSGYLIVEVESVPCVTTIVGASQPTNCADPVDGFASGLDQMWFRVAVQKVGNAYYMAPGYLIPVATGTQIMESRQPSAFGGVALCSPSGKFLGWGG